MRPVKVKIVNLLLNIYQIRANKFILTIFVQNYF